MTRHPGAGLAAALLALVATACAGPSPTDAPPTTEPTATATSPPPAAAVRRSPAASHAPPAPGTALALLASLPVKGRAPRTGYDRDLFGPAWADTDRNGCDTRNDVLRRDLDDVVVREGTAGCVVVAGTLLDPYTGRRLAFRKADAAQVQIDHVVSLSDAWQTGAQGWTAARRLAFANDPLNLLAVEGAVNAAKSDADAATWLPPNRAFRCAFVARQVAVKARYGLWVKPAEREAMARVLAPCAGQPVPSAPAATVPPQPSRAVGSDPRFRTCREAKAAGHGPYRRGRDPEYDWYRDADRDGVVCE